MCCLVRSVGIHARRLAIEGLAELHHIPPGALRRDRDKEELRKVRAGQD